MNRDNILAVADAIEKHSIAHLGFNMQYWECDASEQTPDLSGHNCGTVACIAGWAQKVSGVEIDGDHDAYDVALEYLNLSRHDANSLFMPTIEDGLKLHWLDIQPSQAVAVLRHLAETGKVDWSLSTPEIGG